MTMNGTLFLKVAATVLAAAICSGATAMVFNRIATSENTIRIQAVRETQAKAEVATTACLQEIKGMLRDMDERQRRHAAEHGGD